MSSMSSKLKNTSSDRAIQALLQSTLDHARELKRDLVVQYHDASAQCFHSDECSLGHLGLMIVGDRQVKLYAYSAIRTAAVAPARRKPTRKQMAS
jgi:hypothetical protein